MSIKLYTDKTELFECNVSLDGASIKDSKLRKENDDEIEKILKMQKSL